MKLIAIETSTSACSVALKTGQTIIEKHQVLAQQHGQVTLSWLFSLLAEQQCSIGELDGICYSCGPGGFTGIRIGAAIAQGLSFAAQVPLIAVPSLQVIAQGIFREYGYHRVFILLDARMQQVYLGHYVLTENDRMTSVINDQLLNYEDIELPHPSQQAFLVTDALAIPAIEQLSQSQVFTEVLPAYFPKAYDVITLAEDQLRAGNIPERASALPIYLRSSDSWRKLST